MNRFLLTVVMVVGLGGGCSCGRQPAMPAPNAAEAPTYPTVAQPPVQPEPAALRPDAPLPHISQFPASKDPPPYGLPLEIKIEAPEVPEEIRGPMTVEDPSQNPLKQTPVPPPAGGQTGSGTGLKPVE